MSVVRCERCEQFIDTDFDAEHFDEHQEDKDRAWFEELTGENPEDVLGPDWQNIMHDYLDDGKGRE